MFISTKGDQKKNLKKSIKIFKFKIAIMHIENIWMQN